MSKSSNVPKFGNWESEDNVPYTVYFDKARKHRGGGGGGGGDGGKMINPNDPQENLDMVPNHDPSSTQPASPPPITAKPITKPEETNGRGAVGSTPEHRLVSREEDGDLRQFSNSPGQRIANESNYGGRGQGQRPNRPSAPASDQSLDRSPLHPHYQAKVMGRGSEGKNHDSSHGTPGRSRLRPTNRGDESPDKGAAVPRFGEWDENDPQSAENFTHIFEKVREERNNGAGNVYGTTPKHPSNSTTGLRANQPKKCCCGWW